MNLPFMRLVFVGEGVFGALRVNLFCPLYALVLRPGSGRSAPLSFPFFDVTENICEITRGTEASYGQRYLCLTIYSFWLKFSCSGAAASNSGQSPVE